jgi:hypothetical protein
MISHLFIKIKVSQINLNPTSIFSEEIKSLPKSFSSLPFSIAPAFPKREEKIPVV